GRGFAVVIARVPMFSPSAAIRGFAVTAGVPTGRNRTPKLSGGHERWRYDTPPGIVRARSVRMLIRWPSTEGVSIGLLRSSVQMRERYDAHLEQAVMHGQR